MGRSSTISSKGQITVPLEVRKRLGLKTGDRVEFDQYDWRTVLRRERSPENPFLKYVGAYPAFSSVEQIDGWIREMRDEEAKPQKTRKK